MCEFHKQKCTFLEGALPRKRKLEDSSSDENQACKAPPATDSLNPVLVVAKDVTGSQPRKASKSSTDPRDPLPVDASLSLQRHHHCKYLGQTTALDASLVGLGSFNANNETISRAGTLRQVIGSEFFSIHADAELPIPDDEAHALAEIETIVGPHGPALIDLYFRNVHPSYPVIQNKAFLDRHQHGDRQFNPPLLAAMYLLALYWWSSEPELAHYPQPDLYRLEQIAIVSLTAAMQRPKISAVQAGLLLLQRAKSSTWTLTVQLVALGQDIGLHLDCSDWTIPLWERRLRRRLAWALYMQDKWSALMHGRPSHINAEDWAVQPLIVEDFDESVYSTQADEGEAATDDDPDTEGPSLFMQITTLTSIMSDVCNTFYSQTSKAAFAAASPGSARTQLILSRAKPVQIRLKEWFANLPFKCKMDAYKPGSLCSNGSLHLAYFATEISIHRRIVESLADISMSSSASDQYMLYICRAAAKTRLIGAMDFVNRLKPEHLHSFWFFASTSNFALLGTFGALLAATSPAKEEAQFYSARLKEFRWTLGVCARKAGWISGAREALEANLEMLGRAPDKLPASEVEMSRPKAVEVVAPQSNGFVWREEDGEDEDEMDVDDEAEGEELDDR